MFFARVDDLGKAGPNKKERKPLLTPVTSFKYAFKPRQQVQGIPLVDRQASYDRIVDILKDLFKNEEEYRILAFSLFIEDSCAARHPGSVVLYKNEVQDRLKRLKERPIFPDEF